mgnify:CR=1 FL=1
MQEIDYSKIDEKIRPWVRYLRQHGFNTFGSCQGSADDTHMCGLPSVCIDPDDGCSLEETLQRLRSLVGHKHRCYLLRASSTFRARINFCPYYDLVISDPPSDNQVIESLSVPATTRKLNGDWTSEAL